MRTSRSDMEYQEQGVEDGNRSYLIYFLPSQATSPREGSWSGQTRFASCHRCMLKIGGARASDLGSKAAIPSAFRCFTDWLHERRGFQWCHVGPSFVNEILPVRQLRPFDGRAPLPSLDVNLRKQLSSSRRLCLCWHNLLAKFYGPR